MTLAAPIFVIDFETTGLDPSSAYPIQLGLVVLDENLKKVSSLKWQIRLMNPFEVFKKAFWNAKEVHRHTLKRMFFSGEAYEDVAEDLELLRTMYPTALLGGNNVGFDIAFMRRLFELADKKFPFDYHVVDLTTLAFTKLGVVKLSKALRKLGIDDRRYTKHDALGDAEATADVFIKLLSEEDSDVQGQ